MKWLKIFFILVLLAAGGAGGYAYYLYDAAQDAAKQMYEPGKKKPSALRDEDVSVENRDPISILILGVDEREGDRGRTDTMMVMTVNPKAGSVLMFSIPRDTRTEIPGRGPDKINHAYAYGGVPLAMQTVERFLHVPMDYYVKVNMEGFETIVDQLGGVDVHNEFAFHLEGYDFPEGNLHLNGAEALKYSRMRKDDPRGDIGRGERQQEVLTQVMRKAKNPSVLTKLSSILESLGTNVKTNLSPDELQAMAGDYRSSMNDIEPLQVNGRGEKRGGVWYYIVPEAERKRISGVLNRQLGLS
ncbi:LytR family transcriptional attenuator [Melghirimyces profundicolus]|uniref:LytR family transcriptional attenuator n=1 Tax=Melghirimyces profundicolus TaxID=1242148 RepID=A0A2T6BCG7_9BACL|nr:LCP family protein [Melghirimyces profundicolus]PTX53716.1 LytR family transcriptional attenuator [Melghirimyces profundicolus]